MGSLLLLRKSRTFNKSRYARNRQLARVIFYFGLYINLLIIYGSFSVLYGFVFKFNYAIWVVYFLISSFLLPSAFRVWKLKRVLQYLLSWKVYRTLKSGLLLDFFTKRIFVLFLDYFTKTFTIFFTDKYTLEYFFTSVHKQFTMNIRNFFLRKGGLLEIFKTVVFCLGYLTIIVIIVWV